jgi:hypothetical protein
MFFYIIKQPKETIKGIIVKCKNFINPNVSVYKKFYGNTVELTCLHVVCPTATMSNACTNFM